MVKEGGFSSNLKNDKLVFGLIILVILLGLFIRLDNFSEVGYWNDDMGTIPAGLLWFYPHDYYPGLSGAGKPPVANWLIGYGCMMSYEDFSAVSQIQPDSYAGREALLGEAMIAANNECHYASYAFGVLFFIAITIFLLILLPKLAALYGISFFAFFPYVLRFSRWIHDDVFVWFFITVGLIFLYLAYKSVKGKDLKWFFLAGSLFGLATATKFSAALYLLFTFFLISEKYWKGVLFLIKKFFNTLDLSYKLEQVSERGMLNLLKNAFVSFIGFILFLLAPFGFKPSQLIEVYTFFNSQYSDVSGIILNFHFYEIIYEFMFNINILDLVIFILGIIALILLIRKKDKSPREKFILYLTLLGLFGMILFSALTLFRVAIAYMFGFVLLMCWVFSERNTAPFRLKKPVVLIFLIIYIIFSFGIAYSTSPYFVSSNHLLCALTPNSCRDYVYTELGGMSAKKTAEYLIPILKDNETFVGNEGILFYYLRSSQGPASLMFRELFRAEYGSAPTLEEKSAYFATEDWRPRYALLVPYGRAAQDDIIDFKNKYVPSHTIKIQGKDVVYVYDLQTFWWYNNDN